MARSVSRGQLWWFAFAPPDKRRPVLILTRDEAMPWLHSVMVAPVTSTVRGSPGEVLIGVDEGLVHDSAVNLDHVQTVSKSRLTGFIGALGRDKMGEVCRALAVAVGCAT